MKRLYFAVLCLGAAAAFSQDHPGGVEKILAYQGTWRVETENFNTPFSKEKKESSTLRNDCWRSAGFFVCDQFVDGESKALIIFTYNSEDDSYNSYSVPEDGSEAGSGKLLIKGNVWTYPWEIKQDGKLVYFQVVNVFTAPDAIDYRKEYSADKIHWTMMAKGHERRIKKGN